MLLLPFTNACVETLIETTYEAAGTCGGDDGKGITNSLQFLTTRFLLKHVAFQYHFFLLLKDLI